MFFYCDEYLMKYKKNNFWLCDLCSAISFATVYLYLQ
jgi:hypothetical protein